jgi:signal recognition particle receptor subunit beta
MRGDLISLKTHEDRTIFFDFLQVELGLVKGLKPKFNLYTVPGQVLYEATRKLVLQGADGIVFVADSQMSRLGDDIQSLRSMHRHLAELGMDATHMPCIMQFNKRDLPSLAPVPILKRLLAKNGMSSFESVATAGVGVFETLKAAISLVMAHVQQQV